MGWRGGVEGGRDRVDGGRKGGGGWGGRGRWGEGQMGRRKGWGGWRGREGVDGEGEALGGGHYSVLSFIKFECTNLYQNSHEYY